MHRFFLVIFAVMLCGHSFADIVLSEIMFNPAGNERYDEFIELYNWGDDPVDLFGWLLSDGSKFNTILPFENSSVLAPHQYALILVPNYYQNSTSYENEIPDEALLFTIDRSQFGAYGLKNSEGEPISIHLPDTTLIAKYQYTPDNKDGFSEEKIYLEKGDTNMNWLNSVRPGGTPGYENSVTPKPYDLALIRFDIAPAQPSTKDLILFTFTIQNVGLQAVDNCVIAVQDSVNGQLVQLFESIMPLAALAPQDSIELTYTIEPRPAGEHVLCATLQLAKDSFLENNTARTACWVVETYPPNCVVFNEIMYDTDEKADEWVEIYNVSDSPINLQNWILRDKKKTSVVTADNFILQPGAYCVFGNVEIDSEMCDQLIFNLPELNNSGDELVLMDAAGLIIDSLTYVRSFGGERNISAERICFEDASTSSSNWTSCLDENGCTPGSLNSVSPKEYDAALHGSIYWQPERPKSGETVSVSIKVRNSGRQDIQNISVTMSSCPISEKECVVIGHTTIANLSVGEFLAVNFKWPDVPPGIHLVKINLDMPRDMAPANDEICDTLSVSYPVESVVVNEIMVSPASEACEWIELFNKSDFPIELMNWSFSDSDTSHNIRLADASFLLAPNDFLVLCSDSFFLYNNHISGLIVKGFPALNNDVDDVVICDACNRFVDNVNYTSDWGGATGRSLERINPNSATNERTNWTTCVNADGHTAGVANSVYVAVLPKTTSLTVTPDPFSPDGDGHDDFVALHYALPGTMAHVNLKIYDIKGRLVRFLLNNDVSSAERTVFWDGMNDAGIKCRMGIYIILFEALNENKMCIEQSRKTVVLAGTL